MNFKIRRIDLLVLSHRAGFVQFVALKLFQKIKTSQIWLPSIKLCRHCFGEGSELIQESFAQASVHFSARTLIFVIPKDVKVNTREVLGLFQFLDKIGRERCSFHGAGEGKKILSVAHLVRL